MNNFPVQEKYWPQVLYGKTRPRKPEPNACRELTNEEEEKLFESSEFGCHDTMVVLFHSLWI